jgi:acyl-CoA thioesterase-1
LSSRPFAATVVAPMKIPLTLLFAFCALIASAFGGGKKEKSDLEPVNEDRPNLPHVLILGDSVCRGYTPALGAELKGKVSLYHTRKLAGSTVNGVERIDSWIAARKWDLIHFNFGLHDMADLEHKGTVEAPPPLYEKNLREIVAKLKASGIKLVWATITPIPKGFGDVDTYNAIALRIMQENGIPIDDLHAYIQPYVEKYRLPNDVHYTPEGYTLLARQAAACIKQGLASGKPTGESK